MRRKMSILISVMMAVMLSLGLALVRAADPKAGGHTGTVQSSKLYTDPDPSAGGGLHGEIVTPAKPILDVFAQGGEVNAWPKVYRGQVQGDKRREFKFDGLPVGKYDVWILFDDCFYEGATLDHTGANSLTTLDRKKIDETIMKATPFFDTKRIDRLEGFTGHAGKCRCILQELRTRATTLQDGSVNGGIQIRSLKLALLEDVGPGWSLENTREIKRQEVAGEEFRGLLPHFYNAKLGNIRVLETTKELGKLSL